MRDRFRLDGKVCLVTGSTRGIGYAAASALAEAGGIVVVHGRDLATASDVARALRSNGGIAHAVAGDIVNESVLLRIAHDLLSKYDKIDVLVNNVGGNVRRPLSELSTVDWHHVFDWNVTTSFLLAREFAPAMSIAGWGRIINIGSIMSTIARPGISAYVAAKHAIAGLTKALAAELGGNGITVNAVAPGFIVTDATADQAQSPEFDRLVTSRTPAGRWGRADEIAGGVMFLASDAASFVNGHLLVIDGGLSTSL